MRQKLALALVVMILFDDLILVEGDAGPKHLKGKVGSSKHQGNHKKKISTKAKVAAAAAAGALGGVVIGSALSHEWEDKARNRQYGNGTWRNGGMASCPMGRMWLVGSVLSLTYVSL